MTTSVLYRVLCSRSTQALTLPADLASELAQYDATEPITTPSATTADTSCVAPRTTEADASQSFREADIHKGEAHL